MDAKKVDALITQAVANIFMIVRYANNGTGAAIDEDEKQLISQELDNLKNQGLPAQHIFEMMSAKMQRLEAKNPARVQGIIAFMSEYLKSKASEFETEDEAERRRDQKAHAPASELYRTRNPIEVRDQNFRSKSSMSPNPVYNSRQVFANYQNSKLAIEFQSNSRLNNGLVNRVAKNIDEMGEFDYEDIGLAADLKEISANGLDASAAKEIMVQAVSTVYKGSEESGERFINEIITPAINKYLGACY